MLWEISHYFKKLCYDVGFDIFAVRRIEVDAVSGPCSVLLSAIVVVILIIC